MELEEPKVSKPLYVQLPPEFISAPPLETPVPLIVSASDVAKVYPAKSNAPLFETNVPLPFVPKGVFAPLPVEPSFKIPAVIVVNPV
jgi:hypothetical protein